MAFTLYYKKEKVNRIVLRQEYKYIITLLLIMCIPLCMYSQKKEIAEVKSCLKSGKNLDKAETLMRKVIAMPEQNTQLECRFLLSEVMRKQYEEVNELMYLKKMKDTTQMFNVLQRMFVSYESLDSVDAMPDKKGNVRLKYRKKNAEYLNQFRPNLFKGGMYFMRHKDMTNAYQYFDMYVDCHQQPLFSDMHYEKDDTLANEAAYWALVAGHRIKDYAKIKKYELKALDYLPKAHFTIALLHESYMEQNDTAKAVAYLRKGFQEYPQHHYFFPRLVDYYVSQNQLDTVCQIVDRACELEPGNQFYRLARNTIQLNMSKYDECIALGDSLIHVNDKMAEAYLNVGTAYFNKALERNNSTTETKRSDVRKKREEVNAFYEKAMPYIETYRTLRPRRKKQWAPMLYTIYLNLNKGEKFDEIDNLLKRSQE